MGELRKDYILNRWVIISPKRGKRPHELQRDTKIKEGPCFFCPGNEHMTPSEIGRVPRNGGWQIRWFENKFPAFKPEGNAEIKTTSRFYTSSDSYGYHEVIVETDRHDRQLAQLPVDEIEQVFHVYARRIKELESKPNIKYVNVFKNHGFMGGTSIVHSHSQLMAAAFVPVEIENKVVLSPALTVLLLSLRRTAAGYVLKTMTSLLLLLMLPALVMESGFSLNCIFRVWKMLIFPV